ncbi:MAG: TcpQ domain-containing protein [Bdellovibrionales bacterium]|jgi:hypothetical protein
MQKNNRRHTVLFFGSVSLIAGSLLVATPASAGFKWVSSDEVQSTNVSVAPQGSQAVGAPSSFGAPDTVIIESAPIAPPKAVSSMSKDLSVFTKDGSAPPQGEAVVKGFADRVPLSVALRQILPPEIGFSVAQDVSLGTLVSWRGGAPWRQVLTDMLLPAGLTISEQGQMVHVLHVAGNQDITLAPNKPLPPVSEAGKPLSLLPSVLPVAPPKTVGAAPASLASSSGYLSVPSSALSSGSRAPLVMSDSRVSSSGAWVANSGDMLKKTLETWGRSANVEVSWQAEYDYPIQASVSLSGDFEGAVRSLLSGFQDAKPQPVGYLYNNQSAGQTVLVIQTRGNNYSE